MGVAVLVATCAALYGGTIGHGFTWDDDLYVVPAVLDRSWAGLWRVLRTDLVRAGDWYAPVSGYWRPLASLTLWANGGMPGGAAPFHATNVALHASAAALLLVLLARRLGPALGAAIPLVVALAWAVHPLHTETVAWISCRYELLTGMAALALLLVARDGRPASLALAATAFAAGVLSKESFFALAVVWVVDDWAARRSPWEALPAWVALTAVVVASIVTRRSLGIGTPPIPPLWDAPWNYLAGIALYLGRAVAPLPLTIGHPYGGPTGWALVAGGAAFLALAGVALRWRRLAPAVALFLAPLAPSALAMGGIGEAPDRYFYLPSLGLAWLLAEGIAAARTASRTWGAAALAGVGILSAAGAVATFARVPDWRDNRSLYAAELARRPEDWRANLFFGDEALDHGRVDDALAFLKRAEAGAGRASGSWNVQAVLARAYFLRGEADRSVEHANAAIRIAPGRPMGYLLLSAANHAKGAHAQEFVVADAAAQRWPEFTALRLPRASAMCEVARGQVCEAELERIARLGESDAADAYAELAAQATARHDRRAAQAWLESLRRIEPGHPRLPSLADALRAEGSAPAAVSRGAR